MTRLVLLSLVVIGTAFAPAAQAHNADPNYLTTLRGLEPPIPGLHIEVLNRGDRLLVVADGVKQQVIIDGYSNDPYLRVGPGKRIDVNTNSPAYYLNQDRFGTVSAPANVTGKGAPAWKNVSVAGRFEWHDHRIHWMSSTRPKIVTNPKVKTKVYDWSIPVKVGSRTGQIAGTLFWTPRPGGSMPAWAIGILIVLVLLALYVGIRGTRRKIAAAEAAEAAGSGSSPAPAAPKEAW